MKKNLIYIFLIFIACLSGCADEDFMRMDEERTYTLSLYVPDMVQVNLTRGQAFDGSTVKDLYVYANGFNKEYTPNTNNKIVLNNAQITLAKSVKKIWATANVKGSDDFESLKTQVISGNLNKGYLPMWGEADLKATDNNITIKLNSSVCKVTVEAGNGIQLDSEGSGDNAVPQLCNINEKGYLISEYGDNLNIPGDVQQNSSSAFISGEEIIEFTDDDNGTVTEERKTRYRTYCYPTLQKNAETKSRIVVKSGGYYYPIEFYREEEKEYVDLLPGCWYQVIVTKIEGNGYKTLEDALTYPQINIKAEIKDHREKIFDMVANATDELGVGAEVILDSDGNDVAVTNVFTTYDPIKFTNEYAMTLVGYADWLTVTMKGKPTPYKSDDNNTPGYLSETSGFLYEYELRATRNTSTEPRSTKITVKVGLLERTLTVTQKGMPLKDLDRKIKFYRDKANENQGECISKDYFKSLYWRTNNPEEGIPNIYGALPEDMQNQVSRVGLIFNMIKTEDEKQYTYYIPLNKGETASCSDNIKDLLDSKPQYDLGDETCAAFWLIERDINKLYNVSGYIEIKNETGQTVIKIPVFFGGTLTYLNPDNGQIVPRGDKEPKKGWYYYEYVKVNPNYYIFDRNIGARSNGAWTDGSGGDKYAKGAWFYKQFKTWTWYEYEYKNDDKTIVIKYSEYNGVVEPHESISGELRNLDDNIFNSIKSNLKYDRLSCPYFETTDKPFRIYFPLVRYLEGHCWRDRWPNIDSDIEFHPKDGDPRGDGGLYWYNDETERPKKLEADKHFYWKAIHFTSTGYTTEDFRVTPANGGRTDAYYGLQARPVYRP